MEYFTVAESAHVQLTGRCECSWTVGAAIDHHSAGATNALAAVVVESNWFLSLADELFVQQVEHFQEGHFRAYLLDRIANHASRRGGTWLSPNTNREVHGYL